MNRWTVFAAGLLAGGFFAVPAPAAALHGVSTRDGVDVIAVGDSGVVFRSVDGGAQFVRSTHGGSPLRAVAQNGATILIVGDGGTISLSTDSGLTWTTTTAPGSPDLLAAEAPSASVLYVAGASGTILRSIDAGATWAALASGTAGKIRALRFTDATHGWAAGDDGWLASTADGGDAWSPASLVTPNALLAVDQLGSRVWVGGANSTCWKSGDGGASWTAVNLRIDSRSDVRGVSLAGTDSVFVAGGGGFIRRSTDDGATWTFLQHPLTGTLTHLCVLGARAWATSSAGPAILHSGDAGDTWSLATGTVVTRAWALKQPILAGSQRGSSFALNPVYRSTIYAALGSRFYVSRDDGETWTQFSVLPGTGTKVNAMIVSPKDSLEILCTTSAPQQVIWSNDGGATWNTSLTRAFGEYGIPLEMDPDHPDTVLFGGDNSVLYRSTNFGHTWAAWGSKIFRSPCDLVIVPGADSGVVVVGDGVTASGFGDLWRSNDHGASFSKQFTTASSEIPGLGAGRLANQRVFATSWSVGGYLESDDGGLSWSTTQSTTQTWGTDVCREDPNAVIYGVYGGGTSYLSLDGGATFTTATLPGSNYGFYARDRGCILAEQSGGLFKMTTTYEYGGVSNQAASLVSPAGGESWSAGSVHDVTWNSTNVAVARIAYRRSTGDSWVTLADVPGWYGRWSWTVPDDATTSAEIRVSDAADAWPLSASSDFTIAAPRLALAPATWLDLGSTPTGTTACDTLHLVNGGTGPVTITAVTSDRAAFSAGRTSLVLAPGASDTLGICFAPTVSGPDTAHFVVTADDPSSPHLFTVVGQATFNVGVGNDVPTTFALWQSRPNPFTTRTRIHYGLPRAAAVSLEVFDLQGHRVRTLVSGIQPAGVHRVEFEPTGGDGRRLHAGVYFYRFRAGGFTATRKMLLLD